MSTRGVIFYTDSRIEEPIKSLVESLILDANLPITSTSLKPLAFGYNTVVEGERSYPTYIKQILTALENSHEDYVFFCEHDVLYPKCHFDFTPPTDDLYYYNRNIWRWRLWDDHAITYDRLLSLSGMCCNRELAIGHYQMRKRKIEEQGLNAFRSREPRFARIWGYEPGTKKKKRGGLTDEDYGEWWSDLPIVDIRHKKTFSRPKVELSEFTHPPTTWKEIPIDMIPGWNLKGLFNI